LFIFAGFVNKVSDHKTGDQRRVCNKWHCYNGVTLSDWQ